MTPARYLPMNSFAWYPREQISSKCWSIDLHNLLWHGTLLNACYSVSCGCAVPDRSGSALGGGGHLPWALCLSPRLMTIPYICYPIFFRVPLLFTSQSFNMPISCYSSLYIKLFLCSFSLLKRPWLTHQHFVNFDNLIIIFISLSSLRNK